ncbi:ATP-binding cassette sub-family G member 1 [Halotydeus destructor]|nr:ATP-binding cassette sub-family G member 1 [Halotydeus destructor]
MSASEVTGGESETTINVGSDTNLTMDSPTEATLNSSKGEEGSKEVFVDALDTFKGVYVNKGFDSIELDEKVKHGVEGNNNNNSNNNGVNGTSGPLKPTTFMPTIGSKSTKSLVWNNLSFEVVKRSWTLKGCQVKREVTLKQILKPQNGEIVAGTLTALMGPSGAGKSTLLNCLIGHYVTGVKGEVYCNPADYAIEVAYGDYGQECFQKMEENNRLVDYHNVDRGMKFDLKKVTDKARKKKLPFWRHTQLLLARNWANVFRDSNQFWYRNLQGVAIAFLVSFLWVYEVGENDACWSNFESAVNKTELKDNLFKINITATKDEYLTKISRIADNSAFIFANCIYIMMTSLMSCVLAFPMEAHIVVKEVSNNWYKILPYYLAKTVADFPT